MYNDKKSKKEIEKDNEKEKMKEGYFSKFKNYLRYLSTCCRNKKKNKKI